jgi:hypothetical protein
MTELQLTKNDRQALELAIETARKLRPDLVAHYLATETWTEAAVRAASICQTQALRLKPWQYLAPCDVEINDTDAPGLEHHGIAKSAALLRKMLALGVSRWHPDPISAIEAVERERVA